MNITYKIKVEKIDARRTDRRPPLSMNALKTSRDVFVLSPGHNLNLSSALRFQQFSMGNPNAKGDLINDDIKQDDM